MNISIQCDNSDPSTSLISLLGICQEVSCHDQNMDISQQEFLHKIQQRVYISEKYCRLTMSHINVLLLSRKYCLRSCLLISNPPLCSRLCAKAVNPLQIRHLFLLSPASLKGILEDIKNCLISVKTCFHQLLLISSFFQQFLFLSDQLDFFPASLQKEYD